MAIIGENGAERIYTALVKVGFLSFEINFKVIFLGRNGL